jgi:hypothetical protein
MLLSQEQAFVATDTLAVDERGRPKHFTTKAFVIPHLKLVIAGTGIAGLTSAWLRHINESMTVSNIDHLNYHAQVSLAHLFRTEFPDIDGYQISSTVYHVGVGADGDIHGYSYSSMYGFESRPLQHGLLMKPTAGEEPDAENQRSFIELMEAQKRYRKRQTKPRGYTSAGKCRSSRLIEPGIFRSFHLDT